MLAIISKAVDHEKGDNMIIFLTRIKKNITVICIAFGLFAAIAVLFSWLFGYWSNGLFNTHFQIESCWQGYTAMGIGLVGLLKWLIDSGLNTPKGISPDAKEIGK